MFFSGIWMRSNFLSQYAVKLVASSRSDIFDTSANLWPVTFSKSFALMLFRMLPRVSSRPNSPVAMAVWIDR